MGSSVARRLHTIRRGKTVGKTVVALTSALVLVVALVAGLIAGGVFSSSGPASAKQAAPKTTTTTNAAEARRQLISDVTMVPLNGSTAQSPASVVAVHATGAQLESVKVEALKTGSQLPGTLDAVNDEWLASGELRPSTAYAVIYKVEGNGLSVTGSGHFSTAAPQA